MINIIQLVIASSIIFSILINGSTSSEVENFGSKSELKFLSEESLERNMHASDTATEFDSYVLAMQLPITYCFKYTQCHEKLVGIPKNTFTIHGLWPNLHGHQKEDCNIGDTIDVMLDESNLVNDARRYWKSLKDDDKSFWDHEFNKHGYCWALRYQKSNPKEFFRFVIDLYLKLDLENAINKANFIPRQNEPIQEFSYQTLMERFAPVIQMNFDLKCLHHEGKQYLSDVFINLDLNFKSLPGNIGSNCNKNQSISIILQ